MRTVTMTLIIFQIIAMCTQTCALGYSKCKLPKGLLFGHIFILMVNLTLIIFNEYRGITDDKKI